MQLGKVTGQVISTVRCDDMPRTSLLLVELLNSDGSLNGESLVAADPVGAGEGEWVIVVRGSTARHPFSEQSPVDAAIVGIVDNVNCGAKAVYSKNLEKK